SLSAATLPPVCTFHLAETTRVQTVHFDTKRETSKWLARPLAASASPNASSAGSLTFSRLLQLPQSQGAGAEPVGHYSPSGGDAPDKRPAPYAWLDDEGSVSASDTAPQ